MSEALTDSTDSTEIEIKLDNKNDENVCDPATNDKFVDPSNISDSPKKSYKTVEPKHIANLTDDERATIIASVRNGVEQPYYDVKFYKNGNTRIIKRKLKQPSTAEKIINSQPLPPTTEAKKYYTDNQLLFEHIIELNAKIDKLTSKHKKLKKKYNTIRNDIYADDEDIVEQSPLTMNLDPHSSMADPQNITSNDESHENSVKTNDSSESQRSSLETKCFNDNALHTILKTRSNWRSQVKYL